LAGETLSSYIVDSSSPSIPKWSLAFFYNSIKQKELEMKPGPILTLPKKFSNMHLHGILSNREVC